METKRNKTEIITYKPRGTCCEIVQIELLDNVIKNIEFYGGCDGNLKGIQTLLKDMHIDDVIYKFSGITCGDKKTSCPDQLASFLAEYKSKNS